MGSTEGMLGSWVSTVKDIISVLKTHLASVFRGVMTSQSDLHEHMRRDSGLPPRAFNAQGPDESLKPVR